MKKWLLSMPILLLIGSYGIVAQEIPDSTEPFGSLISSTTFEDGILGVALDEEKKKTKYFFAPSVTDTETVFISGLTSGVIFTSNTQIDVRFVSIGADDGSTDTDQYRFRLKQKIFDGDEIDVAVAGQLVDLEDVREDVSFTLAGDYKIGTGQVIATANFSWNDRRPDSGTDIDDFGGGLGIAIKTYKPVKGVPPKKPTIGVDYTFENDINGDDNVSFAVKSPIGASSTIGFGIASNSTVFANYLVRFQ